MKLELVKTDGGWRNWAVLSLLVILLQTSFWWLSAAVQKLPEPPSVIKQTVVRSARVQPLPRIEAPAVLPPMVATAETRETRLPMVPPQAVRNRCVRGTQNPGVRIQIEHEYRVGQPAQGLLIQFAADNVAPYVNGALIAPPRGKFDARPSRDGRQPWLLGLPSHLLKDGVNTIDLLVVHNGCLPMVTHVQLGDYSLLKRLYDKGFEMRWSAPLLAVILASLVGAAGLMLLPISDNRRLILAFGVMMLSLAAWSNYSIWNDWRFDQADFAALGATLAIMTGASSAYFVFAVSGARHRLEGLLIIGVTAVHLGIIALAWLKGWTSVQTYIDTPFLFVAALYMAARLLIWFRASPAQALWPTVVFSIFVATTLNSQVTSWLMKPMTFNTKHLLPFYLVTGLGLFMLYRGFSLYREAEAARASLAIKVSEKEQEIRASYLKLREQEKLNAIHGERQRLISDMHDGIGGQLMSLLMLVKSKAADPAQLPQAVQSIIEDLRLIIDSMDSAGDSLSAALLAFRDRVTPRLQAGGIEVVWQDDLSGQGEGLGPQKILQIYRILQEAITNVIKHAEASRLEIAFWADPEDPDTVRIRIADNGRGLGETPSSGRGMGSMRRRAAELGATMEVTQGDQGGVVLAFALPLPAMASA